METQTMRHHRNDRKLSYPVDLDLLAADLERRGIDIAPTRTTWQKLAQCIANLEGEQGREAFHRIAAVWPYYSRHDSELCYNRALKRCNSTPGINYLVKACRRHGINVRSHRYRKQGKPVIIDNNGPQPIEQIRAQYLETALPAPVNQEVLESTLPAGRDIQGHCPLTDLMLNIYPREQVLQVITDYLVGYESLDSGKIDNSILYWQVDNNGTIYNAKRICYKAGGHRDKKVPPMIIWSHRPQCLFGLHRYNQQNRHMPVAIVESEKSALIMSIVKPDHLWMATGSLNNFNEQFLEPVKDAVITAYPDVDNERDKKTRKSVSYELWRRIAARLNRKGWNITVSSVLEDTATTSQRLDKIDIADIAIGQAKQEFINSLTRKP